MTGEQKEKIIRFRRQSFGYADIGRELGISKDTVKSFCRRHGLTGDLSKQPEMPRVRCAAGLAGKEKTPCVLLQVAP